MVLKVWNSLIKHLTFLSEKRPFYRNRKNMHWMFNTNNEGVPYKGFSRFCVYWNHILLSPHLSFYASLRSATFSFESFNVFLYKHRFNCFFPNIVFHVCTTFTNIQQYLYFFFHPKKNLFLTQSTIILKYSVFISLKISPIDGLHWFCN